MGCIEILNFYYYLLKNYRLIETWDVLKSFAFLHKPNICIRLIETWDVLKYDNVVRLGTTQTV